MVSNCPKCQIVRGVKLSSLPSWCQIVLLAIMVSNCLKCQMVLGVRSSAVSNGPRIHFGTLIAEQCLLYKLLWQLHKYCDAGDIFQEIIFRLPELSFFINIFPAKDFLLGGPAVQKGVYDIVPPSEAVRKRSPWFASIEMCSVIPGSPICYCCRGSLARLHHGQPGRHLSLRHWDYKRWPWLKTFRFNLIFNCRNGNSKGDGGRVPQRFSRRGKTLAGVWIVLF